MRGWCGDGVQMIRAMSRDKGENKEEDEDKEKRLLRLGKNGAHEGEGKQDSLGAPKGAGWVNKSLAERAVDHLTSVPVSATDLRREFIFFTISKIEIRAKGRNEGKENKNKNKIRAPFLSQNTFLLSSPKKYITPSGPPCSPPQRC